LVKASSRAGHSSPNRGEGDARARVQTTSAREFLVYEPSVKKGPARCLRCGVLWGADRSVEPACTAHRIQPISPSLPTQTHKSFSKRCARGVGLEPVEVQRARLDLCRRGSAQPADALRALPQVPHRLEPLGLKLCGPHPQLDAEGVRVTWAS